MTEDTDLDGNGQDTPPNDADGGGEQPGQGERTFTQAELNSIVADRAKRMMSQMMGDLGFDNADALKGAVKELADIKEAQMSELEKAQARITELEAASAEAQERAVQTLIRSAFLAEAAKLGAAHPEDAYLLAELDKVDIDEAGNVQGVAEVVAALAEAGRLVMAGKAKAPNLDGGAGSGTRSSDRSSIERAVAELSPDELHMASKMRLTPEEYAESKLEIAKAKT